MDVTAMCSPHKVDDSFIIKNERINLSQRPRCSQRPRLVIREVLKKGTSSIRGKAKVHPETRRQWYLLWAVDFTSCSWEVDPPQYNSPIYNEISRKT